MSRTPICLIFFEPPSCSSILSLKFAAKLPNEVSSTGFIQPKQPQTNQGSFDYLFFWGGSNKQHIYGHFEGFPAKHVHCLGWCHIKKSGESCKRSHIVPSTSSENISSQTAFFVTHQQNCRSQIKFAWNFFRDKQNPQKQRVFF